MRRKSAPRMMANCVVCGQSIRGSFADAPAWLPNTTVPFSEEAIHCRLCRLWIAAGRDSTRPAGYCEFCGLATGYGIPGGHTACWNASNLRDSFARQKAQDRRHKKIWLGVAAAVALVWAAVTFLPPAPWVDTPLACNTEGLSTALASPKDSSGIPVRLAEFSARCRADTILVKLIDYGSLIIGLILLIGAGWILTRVVRLGSVSLSVGEAIVIMAMGGVFVYLVAHAVMRRV